MTDKQSKRLDFNSVMLKMIGALFAIIIAGGGWWGTTVWGDQVKQGIKINSMDTRIAVLETKLVDITSKVDNISSKVDNVQGGVEELVNNMRSKENRNV